MIVENFDLWGLGTRKLQKRLKIDPFWFVLKSLKSRQADKFWIVAYLGTQNLRFAFLFNLAYRKQHKIRFISENLALAQTKSAN